MKRLGLIDMFNGPDEKPVLVVRISKSNVL